VSSSPTPVRVIVVDDHPMLREGTEALLARAPGIIVVGAAGEGGTALGLIEERRPDVLLLDLRLPDMSGIEVARQVRRRYPAVAILVLTGFDDAGYVRALQQLGVRGYLDKSVGGGQIIAAIRAVAAGGTVLVSEALHGAAAVEPLTAREHEVLALVAAGRRNKEIALALRVSEKTVEFHVTNLFVKLRVQSRTEVALKAREYGLLGPPSPSSGPAWQ